MCKTLDLKVNQFGLSKEKKKFESLPFITKSNKPKSNQTYKLRLKFKKKRLKLKFLVSFCLIALINKTHLCMS